MKFAIDGDMLILVDDDGHEFKMHVGKRRNNTITERVEECRSTVQEIHQAYPDLPQLNTWLASLAGPELLNIHSHNLGCSADCMQVRDMALLSQLEVIRAEMLVARTAKDRPGQQQVSQEVAVDGCKALVSAVEGGPIKDMAQGQLADSARRLYDCAMDEYKHDENKWFLPTARAREKLLVEVLARQTGAPIGEHQQAQPSEAGK